MDISITDEELKSFTNAVLERVGVDFTCYEPVSLKRRISRAVGVLGFNNVFDLWTQLLQDRNFIYPLMDEISVGLTSMFRDPVLWNSLRKHLLEATPDPLSVWHAGCSTGEEVYSMGILLKECGRYSGARALATDISLQAINKARQGQYHKSRIAEFKENYHAFNPTGRFDRYCKGSEDYYTFDQNLVNHVDFQFHNLITSPFSGNFDMIFCRNVMIYFDTASKVNLMKRFHQVLKPGGLFVIGFYDAVTALVDQSLFDIVNIEARIFRARPVSPEMYSTFERTLPHTTSVTVAK